MLRGLSRRMLSGALGVVVASSACSKKSSSSQQVAGSAAPATIAAGSGSQAAKLAGPVDDRYDSEALGAIKFELNEGTPEARRLFMHGLLALHSFWYDEAIRKFDAAMGADPSMNMAYWGAAMARCKLLWGEDDVEEAREIINRMPSPRDLPLRQQAWVMAAVALLQKGDVRSSRQRFLATMEQLHAKFPDDESTTFLSIALIAAMRPEDPDALAIRKRAAALALEVFKRNPKHPGAAHYFIHAYDAPELAAEALPQAQVYAKIAPAAFHARHMPAHIFKRLGMWSEAIASCQAAWDASVDAAKREKLTANHHDFHSLHWLVEMPFELGHRKQADAALALFASSVKQGLTSQLRAQYATQVTSYIGRTGEWTRVEELLEPLKSPPVADPKDPLAPARIGSASHCATNPSSSDDHDALIEQTFVAQARALAASHQHDVTATRKYADEMTALRTKLRPFFEATQPKEVVAQIEKSHERYIKQLLARAANNDRQLLTHLRESADDADKEVGGESNPQGLLVREEIADVLLRLGQVKDAIAEYRLVLVKNPNRARALLGLARAAAKAGDAATSKDAYGKLAALWSTAEDGFAGLAEVRAALATK